MSVHERREQNRRDADAATERRLRVEAARGEQARADATAQHARRQSVRKQRRARRSALLGRARRWYAAHAAELLIAPLAVASATLAVPAMATYGRSVYGAGTGVVLPVLSELGMWAFALAVPAKRRTDPEAPVWALRAGVALFAVVGFGLNAVHGLRSGVDAGVVMGVCSIAGVVAHQLVCAGPRRSRSARQTARLARQGSRKLAAARRAAVRDSVVELDADGAARLSHRPGRYQVRRGRLVESSDPGGLADEVSAYLARTTPDHPGSSGTSPLGLLNPPEQGPDQQRTTLGTSSGTTHGTTSDQAGHDMVQLRTRLDQAARAGEVNPHSAASIARVLGIRKTRAAVLRDDYEDRQ